MARILVIDDEPQVRTMLRELLEDESYEVVDASNGKEGLALYRKESIDLVITDLIMPEKEGIETIRELRKISPEVKIIAISGGSRLLSNEFLTVAKALGAQRILKKPIAFDELRKAIEELLQ